MRCGGRDDNNDGDNDDEDDDEPTALHIYYQMTLSFNSHLSRVCFSLEILFFRDFCLSFSTSFWFRFWCRFLTRARFFNSSMFYILQYNCSKERMKIKRKRERFSDLSRSFGALRPQWISYSRTELARIHFSIITAAYQFQSVRLLIWFLFHRLALVSSFVCSFVRFFSFISLLCVYSNFI